MKLVAVAATDLGLRREINEDSVTVWIPADAAVLARHGGLFVVADGMGGAKAGEIASRIAVETVVSGYREASGADPLAELRGALEAANRRIHAESVAHADMNGMGTTCTALFVNGERAGYAHVGDSRAYLLRDGALEQLTHDHSLVAQLVRDHQLTAEQARVDPRRNVVTRSVGVAPLVEIDAQLLPMRLRAGDRLLLCTDGLHGLVADDELAAFASQPDLDAACDGLVALARERGGHDNISLILVRLDP